MSDKVIEPSASTPHFHRSNEDGRLVKCFHECRTLLTDYKFWIGLTISFPFEHWLWECTPLSVVTRWLGL